MELDKLLVLFDPAILFLVVYPTYTSTYRQSECTKKFTAALLILEKRLETI